MATAVVKCHLCGLSKVYPRFWFRDYITAIIYGFLSGLLRFLDKDVYNLEHLAMEPLNNQARHFNCQIKKEKELYQTKEGMLEP